jgi:DNA-binding NtrC family response regulator
MRVLVVDDHDELRKLTVQFLEILGHSPLEASDAVEAERIASSPAPIDIVLLDLQLGAASGLALADDLERTRPDLRVLFMSGYGREEYFPHLPERPRRRFIEKPFTLKALETALAGLMAAG